MEVDRKTNLKEAGYTFCDKEEEDEDEEGDEAAEQLNIMVMEGTIDPSWYTLFFTWSIIKDHIVLTIQLRSDWYKTFLFS